MEPCHPDHGENAAGRRAYSRLRVRLPARLTTLDGTFSAILTDLSLGGAKLSITKLPTPGFDAVLSWYGYEAFGSVSWAHDGMCGMRFEEIISPRVPIATRDIEDAEHLPSDRDLVRGFADKWVRGERLR